MRTTDTCSFLISGTHEPVPQMRTFVVDDYNRRLLRFLLYYFNNCPLAEQVFPERRYKLSKPLFLTGNSDIITIHKRQNKKITSWSSATFCANHNNDRDKGMAFCIRPRLKHIAKIINIIEREKLRLLKEIQKRSKAYEKNLYWKWLRRKFRTSLRRYIKKKRWF